MAARTASRPESDRTVEKKIQRVREMDVLFTAFQGWPGIHSPEVKDWIAKHQIQAAGWYVAHPDLTVRDIRRLKRVGKALDELLDSAAS